MITHTHTHTYTHTHTHTYILYLNVYTHTFKYTDSHLSTNRDAHECTYTYTHITNTHSSLLSRKIEMHMSAHTTHAYIKCTCDNQLHTHTHTHTHTHHTTTCIHKCVCWSITHTHTHTQSPTHSSFHRPLLTLCVYCRVYFHAPKRVLLRAVLLIAQYVINTSPWWLIRGVRRRTLARCRARPQLVWPRARCL
jgi:hypothetical protein